MSNATPSYASYPNPTRLHRVPRLEEVVEVAAKVVRGVTAKDILSHRRTDKVYFARVLAVWMLREHTAMSYPEIAAKFGRSSHSTFVTMMRSLDDFCLGKGTLFSGRQCYDFKRGLPIELAEKTMLDVFTACNHHLITLMVENDSHGKGESHDS